MRSTITTSLLLAVATASALPGVHPKLAALQIKLEAAHPTLTDIPLLYDQQEDPEAAWRLAREELNRDNLRRAAELFSRFISRYPRSPNVGDAYYWQAFALSRLSGTDNLHKAKQLLETQKRQHAKAGTRNQSEELLVRIQTELARSGDSGAAEDVTRRATRALEQECPKAGDEDIRSAALNALLQMDAENATPVLKQVMARKDACSAPLRRRAVFMLSQRRTTETEDLLLEAARSDPDREVRLNAVFWLSQINTEKALGAIETVLNNTNDAQIQERAIFALSQHRSARASQILRTWAESDNRPAQLRQNAIFALSQQRDPQNGTFLRTLYAKLPTGQLKEQVLFALTQRRAEGNEKFLMDVAQNEQESLRIRKSALFHAGQMRGNPIQDFVTMYDRISNFEMKEQLIFVFSQRRDREAVDKLIDIARKEQDKRLKERAIFWLGQSKDPRAAQVLLEIIGQ